MQRGGVEVLAPIVAGAAAIYLAVAAYMFIVQRSYVFQPSGSLMSPTEAKIEGVEALRLRMRDGLRLTAWYAAAVDGLPTILYFHGNSGSLSDRADRFRQIRASGFGLLAASYRGYPGSEGAPSEAALVADGLELFDWLAGRSGDIVVHGESLGTGVATEVAGQRPVRALVLEAPFTAALDIARAAYPWLPTGVLMRDPFLSRDHVRKVSAPVLVIHGTADRIIPIVQGRRLHALIPGPKRLAVIEGGTHGNLWERGLWTIELEFLLDQGVAVHPAADAVRRMPSLAG